MSFTRAGHVRHRLVRGLLLAFSALALILLPAVAHAQMTRGGINGTVRDASGGVIPGATVTITNVGTNQSRDIVTDAQGAYRVVALEPGTYDVKVVLEGFAPYEVTGVRIVPSQEATINVDLKIAGTTEEVTVTAESKSVELNKSSATIATTLNTKAVEELPLPGGRNLNNLILTSPNVASTGGQGTYAANGQRSRNNNYMIDGSDNNDISVTISTTQLVPEAVAEFQVITNPYSVEFGRNSGAQVNVVTKSGTNKLKGDGWDYYTSSKFYSLTNIEKANGQTSASQFNRHQAGFDLGGPIFKDRTFFYGLYQWDGQRPGATPQGTVRVPTPLGLTQLQSAPLGAGQSAASRQAVLQKLSFLQDLYAKNAQTFRSYQNVSVNGAAIETAQTNFPGIFPSTYNSYIARVDHKISSYDNITGRVLYTPREDIGGSNSTFGDIFSGKQVTKDSNYQGSNTHIFSDRVLNEFRFSLVRRDLQFPENDPKSPSAAIGGFFNIGGATNYPQSRVSNAFQFNDSMTWTRDKHTLKFGADIRYNKMDNFSGFNTKGSFTFDNLQTYMNNFASQYLQAVQTASFNTSQTQNFFYAQDDYRVNPDLTLNLGLRYELSGAPLGFFGATDQESLNAMVPGPVKMDKNNWAPRVGFAYSPHGDSKFFGDGKTVIRGGYGKSYDFLFYNLLTVNGSNYPRVTNMTLFNQQDVYPNILTASGAPVFNPQNTWVNSAQDTVNPESRFWSADISRDIRGVLLQLGYTGSRTALGINQIEENPGVLTAAQAATVIATGSTASIPGVQARRVYPQYGSRVTIPAYVGPGGNDVEARSTYHGVFVRADKRYAHGMQFGGSYTYGRFFSNNDASLGEGGTAQSPQIPQSYFNYGNEWSVSAFDRRHRFVFNYMWDIPGPKAGVWGAVAGGWKLAGVTQTQSGAPFTVRTGVDTNGDGSSGSDRPDINPSGTLTWNADHSAFVNNGYFVTTLGSNGLPLANTNPAGGNSPRNGLRGPGYWNTDVSLSKRFALFGSTGLTVRVDGFNIFTQENKGTPVLTMNSASFGQNTNSWGRRSFQFSGKFSF